MISEDLPIPPPLFFKRVILLLLEQKPQAPCNQF